MRDSIVLKNFVTEKLPRFSLRTLSNDMHGVKLLKWAGDNMYSDTLLGNVLSLIDKTPITPYPLRIEVRTRASNAEDAMSFMKKHLKTHPPIEVDCSVIKQSYKRATEGYIDYRSSFGKGNKPIDILKLTIAEYLFRSKFICGNTNSYCLDRGMVESCKAYVDEFQIHYDKIGSIEGETDSKRRLDFLRKFFKILKSLK